MTTTHHDPRRNGRDRKVVELRPVEGRVPPHDLDAEAAVLSAMLLKPEIAPEIAVLLPADRFYSDANGWIARACYDLSANGRKADIVTVASWLRDRERFAQIGGAAYLAQLADATPAYAHVEDHARTVREKWQIRQLIATCQRIAAEGYGDYGAAAEFIDGAESAIHEVVNDRAEDADAEDADAVLRAVFAELSIESGDPGVDTGLRDLDDLICGTKPGQMMIVAAHSGVGKSAMGMQMVLDATRKRCKLPDDRGVGHEYPQAGLVFSCEMTAPELMTRAVFSEARVHGSKSSRRRMGTISREEWQDISGAARDLARKNVYFEDRPGITPLHVRAKARRVAAQAKKRGQRLRLILVDYIQLLNPASDGERRRNRRDEELADISRALKNLAKELEVAVVVLAQLNNDAIGEKRLPSKDDLRECKAMVHDADKVILIWNAKGRARSHTPREPGAIFEPEEVDILIDKCRGGGETGHILCWFTPHLVRFDNMDREDQIRTYREREEASGQKTNGKGRS